MKILVSKYAGFCGGVKAAVLMLERALRQHPDKNIKVLGQLVHNKDVNQDFMDRGVQFIQEKTEAQSGDLVFIRAHGTPSSTYKYFRDKQIDYVDATCYKVKNTQQMIESLEADGWQVAVYGEDEHPETIGLVGHTSNGFMINNKLKNQIQEHEQKIALVCQSTSNRQEFLEIVDFLKARTEELYVNPTFCDFTVDAQSDARSIRDKSDLMLVIGGENSSNTCRLQEICAEKIPSFHIQSAEQIKDSWLKGKQNVGITAGASTPASVIQNIVQHLESKGGEKIELLV